MTKSKNAQAETKLYQMAHEAILNHIPGMICVYDHQLRLVMSNNATAKLFGYQDETQLLGTTPHQMRCPAVNSADEFSQQFQHVIKTQQEMTLFDIHEYAQHQQKIFITKKKLIALPDQQNAQQILCLGTEISSTTLSTVISKLLQIDKYYGKKLSSSVSQSYYVGRLPHYETLTERELECLFYLVRGKIAKEIARILATSNRTVEAHLRNIKCKLGLYSKSEMIEYGIANGLLSYIPHSFMTGNLSINVSN